jgi:zinc transport system substrate-binding protein
VSIPPQEYFARRIGSGRIGKILVLAGPGQNPHNYEPKPRQLAELAGASAWVLSGIEFEAALRPKIAGLFPALRIINGTEGVKFRRMAETETEGHDHAGESDHDEHNEAGVHSIDRHSWLGLEPAKLMALHIRDVFCALDPPGAAQYDDNCASLIQDMEETFRTLRRDLTPLRGKTVFVYHPAFGYFFDEFGILQEAVETGGKEPTPRILAGLIEKARAEKAGALFVQAQFPAEAARAAAAASGAELVSLDPLAADWLANIRYMGEALKKAAGKSAGTGNTAVPEGRRLF